MKNKIFILYFSMLTAVVFAQQKQLVTSIDKTKNKIGAEFLLTLKTSVDTTAKVAFPNPKNFGALEVIESYKIDTVRNGKRYDLIKKYGLTQFDSGRYVIPRVTVLINNKPFFSDSLRVEVSNVTVDTLKQKMYDIKPIAEVPSSKSWIWKLLLALLLLAGIGAFIYWYLKVRQTKKIEEDLYKTPIEKATSLLNSLEKKQLWQKGEIKAYYSELTDIARNYIEEAIEIPAMESTTSELIEGLRKASQKKNMKLSQETIENLERVLKQADLVKFAKSKPLDFEITEDRKKIESAIVILDKSIPVVVEDKEESLLNEMQRQEQLRIQLKKKRRSRIITASAVVIGIVVATLTFFIVTKGFTYVKDTLFGNDSKELLEGEWVYSEYGNPAVIIETPQVLKRIDMTKLVPKEGMALIKEMQSFRYGGMLDDFQLMVSTFKYKQAGELDLSKSIDGSVQMLESTGAQNMIVKQEEFDTKQGVKGMRAFGTFSRINTITKSSTKIYYEIILFNQEGGLQQLILMHEEGDTYANKIMERILNSVELKQLGQ
ncbi:hypothetical protein [Flavobacterium sp.]|uniref:hypothetical protein n=1 Tax=Flavobacterium sp. TaxID=239 RepID=UPI00261F1F11|nr:hypothetical protein [Flavobacterium sp.]